MLRVMDAPGFCAAFLREGKRRRRGRPERAATPAALYSPLSPPVSSTPGRLFGHGGYWPSSTPRASTRSVRRGGQFSTRAYLGHASNTKGPLRRKTCTQKTAMTPVVATISWDAAPHVRVGLPPNLKLKSGRRPESQTHQSDSLVVVGGDRSAGWRTLTHAIARSHRRHADRLREPDSTTLWYLQIGPEVASKIRILRCQWK